jgi:hypothetical protein
MNGCGCIELLEHFRSSNNAARSVGGTWSRFLGEFDFKMHLFSLLSPSESNLDQVDDAF